jgi:cytochrome c553
MKRLVLMVALVVDSGAGAAVAAGVLPSWSYLFPDSSQPAEAPRPAVYTLPGSSVSYTQKQIDDHKAPPDWFPQSHPVPPRAVTNGGDGMAFACASCHLASGMGHPESGSLAGLPAVYLDRQMTEFRSGARGNHFTINPSPKTDLILYMASIAKAWSEEASRAATQYYATLKPVPGWVKVVESVKVPKSYVDSTYARMPDPSGQTEPLGDRIIELPKDFERTKLRDPNSGTIAYVPIGAVAHGKVLAATGQVACAACHGAKLTGMGEVPSIAGRSPLYAFRQLWMFKEASRNGALAGLMQPQVASLSERDMIDLAAYLATLKP